MTDPSPGIAARREALDGEEQAFSPLVEGPLHVFYLRTGLCRRPLGLARRRAILHSLVAWLPLLLLTIAAGTATGNGVAMSFARDVEVHVRLLLVLPILVGADAFAHELLSAALLQFRSRGLVLPSEVARFERIRDSARRLARSRVAEAALVAAALLLGGVARRWGLALDTTTWYSVTGVGRELTPAGFWYAWFALPLCQFLVMRWAYRFAIWARLMWQVSGLRLALAAGHPDRAAGLGFLAETATAFAPLLTAAGLQVTGVLMNRIHHQGLDLADFKLEIGAIAISGVLVVLAPLVAFMPGLVRVKRDAVLEYGRFGSRLTAGFERRWLTAPVPKEPVTTPELDAEAPLDLPTHIEGIANFASNYETVRGMRVLPFGRETLIVVVLAIVLPLLPLLLATVPLSEILKRAAGLVL